MASRFYPVLCKVIQRKTYTCLSTTWGVWCSFAALVIIVVSLFHFGEVALQWSMVRYAGTFRLARQYDNIAGKSFESRLCLPQPIDIVYTWVNGSDPSLIAQINAEKEKLKKELNITGKLHDSKKKRVKLINTDQYKWKDATICPVPNCVSAYKIAVSGLPRTISLTQLKSINVNFSSASEINFLEDASIAFVSFPSREKIKNIIEAKIKYGKHELNTSEVFYTSTIKNGHKQISTFLMLHWLHRTVNKQNILSAIENKFPNSVLRIDLYREEDIAVVHFTAERFASALKLLSKKNFTILNKRVKLFPVTYIWKPVYLSLNSVDEDLSSNRFADNNELRYSLRSVEKYAPWVRKIFIVTNGQIPNWLNLDHPRISLISHEDIFVNKSHLPTFSSPAIESHIHRIPGLSKKFIYMNDDVFFGAGVWPDDFYTHSNGHKVYLTWAVPNCHEGCPSSWLNDKYCDKACNVSACDWDGGDCIGNVGRSTYNLWQLGDPIKTRHNLGEYCSKGCAYNWIGDRYCDSNCNVRSCGYDAGDCGISNFNKLYSVIFGDEVFMQKPPFVVRIPPNTMAMYINLTNVFDSVKDGNYNEVQVLRSAIISKKFKTLSLTFYKNISKTDIQFQILGYRGANETEKFVLVFNITVNTLLDEQEQIGNFTTTAPSVKIIYPQKLYNTSKYPLPRYQSGVEVESELAEDFRNISLPLHLEERLKSINVEFERGELTELGLNVSKKEVYHKYLAIRNQGRKLLFIDEQDDSSPNEEMKDPYTPFFSFLPWEKNVKFVREINEIHRRQDIKQSYSVNSFQKRRLLDAFSMSLLHVSRIFNKEFGYIARKVPAHMPHMVDRDLIFEMQDRFWSYFDATSSHRMRHPHDMQFAFSFNYYLIGVKTPMNLTDVFDKVDTDKSGILSDRELRSLAALLYELPLTLKNINELEEKFQNCSKRLKIKNTTIGGEVYYDPRMPLVTKQFFLNCHEVWRLANFTASTTQTKYKHEFTNQDEVTFKMIRNNVSYVLYQLDWIRKNRRKFVCLNDDLDHDREDTKVIRTILGDFYESLFPVPSQFELGSNYRNQFLYKRDLDKWYGNRKNAKRRINMVVTFAVIILVGLLYWRKIIYCLKRLVNVLNRRIYSVPPNNVDLI